MAIKDLEVERKKHEDELAHVRDLYERALQQKNLECNLVKEAESCLQEAVLELQEEIARQTDAYTEQQRLTADTLASLKEEVCS